MGLFYNITALTGFPNYGIAIILMTICLKACLYPLNKKQIKSMKAMQEIQPELKKIQKNYKNNPQLMQQKMAELYQESGVNPLAGCLPLLVQMPFLMGVYYSLYGFEYQGEPTFLWLSSLSDVDTTYILPLLSAITTFLTQKQSMMNNGQENQQMKMMMYIMPVFIGYISINFPSGLVLYWVVMNICQIVQQWYMFRNEDSGVSGKAKKGAA
ncbi:MAG: YidC/Oxa1 family membrane protein insertase [Anaerovibrio sp.]|nr:YidC/Oxa1 family membrane protein insertase [Anaerovibrio sp.]